ncbi:MAG: DUF2281 domain-containing protein [Bacteroidetes bacterium]|nr:DUF2281 domain-containing protein [Bacteroidota bacterium]
MEKTSKNLICNELANLPDSLVQEVLTYIDYLKFKKNTDKLNTAFASEKVLAKDWLTVEEDEVWKDL